jgi:ABC-type multidrug transport system permease subunit
MKNIFHLIKKDFKRKWKNPIVILGFLLIPIIFTFIFGFVFGSTEDEILPKVRILVVDKDKSLISQFLLAAFNQGELKKFIQADAVEEEQGRELLDAGKASALLTIPENFGDDVWQGKKAELTLLKNPSEQFLPQIVEEIVDTTSLLLSALFSVFSDELSTIQNAFEKGEFSDADISLISIQVKDRIEGIAKFVFPPLITLKERTLSEEAENETGSLTVQGTILPAIAIMFLLFICNIVFEDVLHEKEIGTLRRLTVSPLKISEFIWSKTATSALIGMCCTLVLVALGRILFAIQWGNIFLVILILFCLNILLAGFISLIYSFIRTEQQAGAVLSSVIITMSLLGGSMMPVENFPSFIQRISKFTPNYWGIKAFQKAILRDPIKEFIPILTGMLGIGILFSVVGAFFMKRHLRKGL